ncbi:MAG TPA: HTTM domain-containing protein [Dehalococcoidia bacterium]|nr:HTTM domain-containing protein [Dehalococcoidia bacterium]
MRGGAVTALVARLDGWWRMPAPATRLALLRVLVGGFALAYVIIRAPNLASVTDFHEAQFAPVGIVGLLGSPLSGDAARLLVAATAAGGVAFVAGWKFRVSGPVFALLLLWTLTYRNSWGQVFHTENILVLHVLILAMSPAADAFSLDARGRAAPGDDARYGWPIRLMCIATVLTYFIAGQTKMRIAGLDWITTDTLRNYVAYDNVRKVELGDIHSPLGAELVRHGWLFPPLAVASLVVELGAPLALLSNRVARAWALAAWVFHAGVFAVMWIVFPYPLLGVAFAPFFTVERIRVPLPRLVRPRLAAH